MVLLGKTELKIEEKKRGEGKEKKVGCEGKREGGGDASSHDTSLMTVTKAGVRTPEPQQFPTVVLTITPADA